jgi:hypothetical protein
MIFILMISAISAETKEEGLHNLNIKQIIVNPNKINNSDYEYGKMLYPQYDYEGLPANFMIKKTPDISIEPKDIKLIEVIKEPWIPENMLEFIVNIIFNPSGQKKIYPYSNQNINNKVALEIDSKVFVIGTILEKLENEMKVIIKKKTAQTIADELRKVSNNVIIK